MAVNALPNLSVQVTEVTNHHPGLGDGLQMRRKDTWLAG